MDPLADSGAIFKYHRHLANVYGAESSLALGWLSNHDQQVRFEALAGIADLNHKTILDAGCGYGDLLPFLAASYQLSHYYGVEQIPELIDEAITRYGHMHNVTFISRNFLSTDLPEVDYIFASGSLNYGSSNPGYIFNAISTLFERCRSGLAFNLLRKVQGSGLLVAYDPQLIIAHCNTLSQNVVLKTGYADDDFTVWVYR